MATCVVVGGGIPGITYAYDLAEAGYDVTLVEQLPFLGGMSTRSFEWSGFTLDYGCHLLDNVTDKSTSMLLNILGDVRPVQSRHASIHGGLLREDMAHPHVFDLPLQTRQKIVYEMLEAAAAPDAGNLPEGSMQDWLRRRFGPTAGEIMARACAGMTKVSADEIDASWQPKSVFARISAVEDGMADLLKLMPALDKLLARRAQENPFRFIQPRPTLFPHRNFYPSSGGMGALGDRAKTYLENLGVKLRLAHRVTAISRQGEGAALTITPVESGQPETLTTERVFWTTPVEPLYQLATGRSVPPPLTHAVPMVMYYFLVPSAEVSDYTYVHNFSTEAAFYRFNTQGAYSGQCDSQGRTVVNFEVICTKESDLWQAPEQHLDAIWEDGRQYGLVKGRRPENFLIKKIPTTIRLPRLGFVPTTEAIRKEVQLALPSVQISDPSLFSRNEIFRATSAAPRADQAQAAV